MYIYINIYIEWSEKAANGIETRPPPCSSGNRIVIKLFWDVAPLTCENFATLCTNGTTTLGGSSPPSSSSKKSHQTAAPIGQCGKPLSYKDCTIHRVVSNFILQSGDFVFGNGSGEESIYNGKKFKDEKAGLGLKHDKKGIVSMGNSGKNSNTSQFFMTLGVHGAPQCDGRHVIFGGVVGGFDVLDAVNAVARVEGGGGGEPLVPVSITACGAFHPLLSPGAGYWFDQPDIDVESFWGSTPVFMARPRVGVVVPTLAVYEKFTKFIGANASCIVYCLDLEAEHVNSTRSEESTLVKVSQQLEIFAVDIILVAPVYAALFQSFELPISWREQRQISVARSGRGCSPTKCTSTLPNIDMDEVILVTKPVDAITAIQMSWVGKMSWS